MNLLRIKREYFNQIKSGSKTLEARAAYPAIRSIKNGHKIQFQCGQDRMVKTVKAVRFYISVNDMLNNENIKKLLSDKDKQEAENVYNSIYPPEKVKNLGGMVVLELM